MPEWDWSTPGPVPTVRPGDIRNAFKVLQPMRQSGKKGIFGFHTSPFEPGCNVAAALMRTDFLLLAVEQEELTKWLCVDNLPDAVFEVAATYPVTIRDDSSLDFEMGSYIAALNGVGR